MTSRRLSSLPLRSPRRRARARRSGRTALLTLMAFILAISGLSFGAGAASAAPVYEIDGRWEAGTPGTVAKGDVINSVWRINVNDDAAAPSNEPVDNVKFTVTLTHGQFKGLPDLCKTTAGLDPKSSVSADGLTLTCNLGSVKQGTAVVVQAPVVADGTTGDTITASGDINGQKVDLSPINIRNGFGMDMLWGTPTDTVIRKDDGAIGFDFEWTLFQDVGSDAGPDTVTYNINVPLENGQEVFLSSQNDVAPFNAPCTPYGRNSNPAPGHPYSAGYGAVNQRAPYVDNCTLTKTGPNSFRMTITGIDYSQTLVPEEDSAGNPMPTNTVAVATGSIWLEVRDLTATTSANLTASAPTYRSVAGQTDPDETANNTSSKVITFPGTWAHAWNRVNGGTAWDNTFKVAPGTTISSNTTDTIAATGVPANTAVGDCTVLDPQYVDYDTVRLYAYSLGAGDAGPPETNLGGTLSWYVGNDPTVTPGSGGYDPDAFTGCGTNAGWTTTEPANKSTVKAVRWVGTAADLDGQVFVLQTAVTIQPNAPIGQDVWSWGGVIRNGDWTYPNRDVNAITPTPGERYPNTSNGRDILHVVFATPSVTKRADRSVVRPGEPATYTLVYSANGSGTMPPTVDDYRIVDTLPAGMTYVAGSADPEPTITNDGGRQVLTWNLDGVPTNTRNTLTYQAVAGASVTPGQTLTNTVTTSLRGETSRPATAQVTSSSSGYTEIAKVADKPYIPNLKGDGDGAGSWTVNMRSFDPLSQPYTDTIDILPYNGDNRGTKYSGTYTVTGVDAVANARVYYTTADPATLNDDPADPSNGTAGNVAGNTVGWSTTPVPNPTAIRVVGPALAPSATQAFTINIATDGAADADKLVNRAQGRAGHTELKMRTSAPISVANFYDYQLKKYVQDTSGKWHDAQDRTDYPQFHLGEKVNYRVVVENIGRGTLTDIDITDDKQPELGKFHIDSLASGKSQTHEYSVTLDGDTPESVVNNACAQASQPADMETPIPNRCDPAGFEFVNYKTVKVADPASGTAVGPGDTIKYTIRVTQQGSSPANAVFTDDLKDVLDDATFNNDVKASIGDVRVENGVISWAGTIPVGQVAEITYSVKVKPANELAKGNSNLVNPVTSPGCIVKDGETPDCKTTNPAGSYSFSKVSDPKSGSTVEVGDTIKYTVLVKQLGEGAVNDATVVDDMTRVLDDAEYNDDAKASSGKVVRKGKTLVWTGDLAVDQVVKITYSVKATADGDMRLVNKVTSPDDRGVCDTKVGCRTVHDMDDNGISPDGFLPGTGAGWTLTGLIVALALIGAGGAAVALSSRRRESEVMAGGGTVSLDDLM
jgi:uncharacterized repeat protein (TIGR01451 family)